MGSTRKHSSLARRDHVSPEENHLLPTWSPSLPSLSWGSSASEGWHGLGRRTRERDDVTVGETRPNPVHVACRCCCPPPRVGCTREDTLLACLTRGVSSGFASRGTKAMSGREACLSRAVRWEAPVPRWPLAAGHACAAQPRNPRGSAREALRMSAPYARVGALHVPVSSGSLIHGRMRTRSHFSRLTAHSPARDGASSLVDSPPRGSRAPPSSGEAGARPHRRERPTTRPATVPRHIGIIMDGNSRWARQRDLPKTVRPPCPRSHAPSPARPRPHPAPRARAPAAAGRARGRRRRPAPRRRGLPRRRRRGPHRLRLQHRELRPGPLRGRGDSLTP